MITQANITKKLAWLLCLTSGLSVFSPVNAKQVATPTMPSQLIGVWYPDNADGHERCQNMKKKKHMEGNIALALEITQSGYNQRAEYGEGNFMTPYRTEKNAKKVWTTYANVTLDGSDEIEGKDVSRFALKNSKITLTELSYVSPRVTQYFKCMGKLPAFSS